MTPRQLLTRHFFAGFFRSELLSEAGIDNYRTWLISAAAALPAFHAQFARLRARNHGSASDELFVFGASFFTLLLIVSLEWQALFPGARDCQVLSPLPVRRSDIFAARLSALAKFLAIAMLAANLVPVLGYASWQHAVAAIGAGLHAVLLAAAVQGLCLLWLPRAFGFLAQAVLLLSAILVLPILLHVPGMQPVVSARPQWLEYFPPAGWLAVSRQLRGTTDAWYLELAAAAWLQLALCAAVTFGGYLALYRNFGEYASPPQTRASRPSWLLQLARIPDRGTFQFLTLVLARSPQHRLLLIGIGAGGLAVALDGILLAFLRGRAAPASASLALPLLLGMGLVTSLTTVFKVPADWPAHWIFRITEDPAVRPRQLESIVHSLYVYAGAASVLIGLPLLIATNTWPAAPLAFGLIACLIEHRLTAWYRVPFTSTYSPDSWPIAMTIVIFLAQLLAFASFGAEFLRMALSGVQPYLILAAMTAIVWTLLRRKRKSHWGDEPLLFSDDGNPEVLVTRFAPE